MPKKILFFLATVLFISSVSPIFAEVVQMRLDKDDYHQGESIYVEGSVTDESSGLVTIVLRDQNNKFVLLSQAFIQSNNTFEKIIPINEKFQMLGTYNATAFVLNMTEAKIQSFNLVSGTSEKDTKSFTYLEDNKELIIEKNKIYEDSFKEKTIEPDIEVNELTYEVANPYVKNINKIAEFVDQTKNPQYYLDRYYNEPRYKSWFDRNYPDLTIEEAVGYAISNNKVQDDNKISQIIPKAEALDNSTHLKKENNSDIAISALAVGGIGILFAAVYGIKKSDVKRSYFSQKNKNKKQKNFSSNDDSEPLTIVQTRLAKGEITVEEYEKIMEKIDKK